MNPEDCVAAILDSTGEIKGTGIVFRENLILTCAHVVLNAGSQPGEPITIRFYKHVENRRAQVSHNSWDEEIDIAVLEYDDDFPSDVHAVRFGELPAHVKSPFHSFGYPDLGDYEGVHATGKIRGLVYRGESNVMLQLSSPELKQGYSGSPVLLSVKAHLYAVGMITEIYYPDLSTKHRDTAFAIPSTVIATVLKNKVEITSLDLIDENQQPRSTKLKDSMQNPVRFFCNFPYAFDANFTGRVKELSLLDQWLAKDDIHPVMVIIGLGGEGKSALAWQWQAMLRESQLPQENEIQSVVWWSFYETNSGPEELLADLLSWLGDEPPTLDNNRLRINRLLEYLQEDKVLLILDGLERLLRLYEQPDHDYLRDSSNQPTALEDSKARECNSLVSSNLLVRLSSLGEGKILCTSRVIPSVFETQLGKTISGIRIYELGGLALEDAHELFENEGVLATLNDVKTIAAPVAYHPLSLRLIAGYVSNEPDMRGELTRAVSYNPNDDLIARKHHVLSNAYFSLPEVARQLLDRISVFRGTISFDEIQFVADPMSPRNMRMKQPNIPFMVIEMPALPSTRGSLRILHRRGLLQQKRVANKTYYGLHPLVRRFVYSKSDDPTPIHIQLALHYARKANARASSRSDVLKLSDIRDAIEAYTHTLATGENYNDLAYQLFENELAQPLMYVLGNYSLIISLLNPLLAAEEGKITHLQDKTSEAQMLHLLSASYLMAGSPGLAIHISNVVLKLTKEEQPVGYLSGIGTKAMAQMQLGQLKRSEWNWMFRLEVQKLMQKEWDSDKLDLAEAVSHQELGRLMAVCGNWTKAENEFEIALEQFSAQEMKQSQLVVTNYKTYAALLSVDDVRALDFGKSAFEIATKRQNPIDRTRTEWLLGWAHLLSGNLDSAKECLSVGLQRSRALQLVELECAILVTLAHLEIAYGEVDLADEYVIEALEIAERCSYRLLLADIYNAKAEISLLTRDFQDVRLNAETAHAYALCDGPPHSYFPAAQRAESILQIVDELSSSS